MEIRLRFKYRVDKNGVRSYGSKNNNSRPKTRSKLSGRRLDAERAVTTANKRVLVLAANGKQGFRRAG